MDFNSVVCEYYERKQQTQQGWCHEDKNDNTPWGGAFCGQQQATSQSPQGK